MLVAANPTNLTGVLDRLAGVSEVRGLWCGIENVTGESDAKATLEKRLGQLDVELTARRADADRELAVLPSIWRSPSLNFGRCWLPAPPADGGRRPGGGHGPPEDLAGRLTSLATKHDRAIADAATAESEVERLVTARAALAAERLEPPSETLVRPPLDNVNLVAATPTACRD